MPRSRHLPRFDAASSAARSAICALATITAMAAFIGAIGHAPAMAAGGGHGIVVLVNDEPITAYEVEQRGRLLALNANIGDYIKRNAKDRWTKIVKGKGINDEFKAYAMKRNPKSREELQKIQQEFIKQKQKAMIDQLQAEARAQASRGTEKQAIKELVEERLKLQEAKRNNVLASDDQVSKIITGIAERNKMNEEQFAKHLAGMGVDISTMRQRFRAMVSWNDVVRRRFGYQVAITERDVDRFVDPALSGDAGEASGGNIELSVQRIVLATPSTLDQAAVAAKLAQADQVRRKFSGCKGLAKLAASAGGKLEDLGTRRPESIAEPTRTLLLNAKAGEMVPPSIGTDGIELWAVCGRKEAAGSGKEAAGADVGGDRSSNAKEERRRKELDILARKHLKDLRQDATIDCRAEAKSGLCQAL